MDLSSKNSLLSFWQVLTLWPAIRTVLTCHMKVDQPSFMYIIMAGLPDAPISCLWSPVSLSKWCSREAARRRTSILSDHLIALPHRGLHLARALRPGPLLSSCSSSSQEEDITQKTYGRLPLSLSQNGYRGAVLKNSLFRKCCLFRNWVWGFWSLVQFFKLRNCQVVTVSVVESCSGWFVALSSAVYCCCLVWSSRFCWFSAC